MTQWWIHQDKSGFGYCGSVEIIMGCVFFGIYVLLKEKKRKSEINSVIYVVYQLNKNRLPFPKTFNGNLSIR